MKGLGVIPIERGEYSVPEGSSILENHGVLNDGGLHFNGKTYGLFETLPNGRMVCKDDDGNITTVRKDNVVQISPIGKVVTKRAIDIKNRARDQIAEAHHKRLTEEGYQIGHTGPYGGIIVSAEGRLTEINW